MGELNEFLQMFGETYFFFFLTAIWLSHSQLWAIFEGTASLT